MGDDHNKELYGRAVTVRELLIDRSVEAPPAAKPFIEALAKESSTAAE